MKSFAVRIDDLGTGGWPWLLDFTLAGLAFDHAFDLLLGPEAAARFGTDDAEGQRLSRQRDALVHHGLGAIIPLAAGQADPPGYDHVFRF